ncbi:putative PRE9-20S proteasome subunit Y13 [Jaminaea rosea]|uniref:Proteasome subunit alpha type n=1 Tax=Jaminaea rosea TaxID=1569628 RepID=A0A316UQW5_9BASI|nr:putative PRE9-20S proteasome subunit Y13 [Jaminaea rosea]PWN26701.1 putative PRE9-20S proteasome subunit Y13 [Jaminaea rosea]
MSSRRYDGRTTTFSPEGRLYQVEYAMEAISHAGTVIGILAKDGVVLAAEKKVTGKLFEQDKSSEKIYVLGDNILGGFAGVTSDANTLVNYARNTVQNVLLSYDDDIPVEHLTQYMCDLKQGYTQYGGLRPFGVSILYGGWDAHHNFQLYHSDPSGNYSGWKATCIGSNNGTATSLLKQDYKEGCTTQEAMSLACKVLSKTMDSTALDSEKIEFAHLTLSPRTGKPQPRIFTAQDIDRLLEREGLAKPKDPELEEAAPTAAAAGAGPAVSGSRGGEGMNVD